MSIYSSISLASCDSEPAAVPLCMLLLMTTRLNLSFMALVPKKSLLWLDISILLIT